LSGDQPRYQHDTAAGKFERIVMGVPLVHIDLPKSCHPMTGAGLSEETEGAIVAHVVSEREFRAGKEADRHVRFSNGGEAARDGVGKFRGYKLIADLGWSRPDEMQTVITHWGIPLFGGLAVAVVINWL
jgi:hypothetical protein